MSFKIKKRKKKTKDHQFKTFEECVVDELNKAKSKFDRKDRNLRKKECPNCKVIGGLTADFKIDLVGAPFFFELDSTLLCESCKYHYNETKRFPLPTN